MSLWLQRLLITMVTKVCNAPMVTTINFTIIAQVTAISSDMVTKFTNIPTVTTITLLPCLPRLRVFLSYHDYIVTMFTKVTSIPKLLRLHCFHGYHAYVSS